MQTKHENKQDNVDCKIRFKFDFEEYSWNNNKNVDLQTCGMARNALNKIETERKNIEYDLKILEALKQETSVQKDILFSLIQLKEKLTNRNEIH
jgi:hypothetical protein